MTSITQSEVKSFFQLFNIGRILKIVGAYKARGIPAVDVFQSLFELAFSHITLFMNIKMNENNLAEKDTFYRFINSCHVNWMRFTSLLASSIINEKLVNLTDEKRVNVFIVDDTPYERNRSKSVELLSRVYDHSKGIFIRGFRLLTLGWSDGNTFVPINSCLLTSADAKNRFQEASDVDKRTCGYRQRQIAQGTAPVAMMEMMRMATASGLLASYVLFDSWFSTPSNIVALKKEETLDVIAIVKKTPKVHYRYESKMLAATEIYKRNRKRRGRSRYLLSVQAEISGEDDLWLPVQLVFVRNRNRRKDYLVLVSTDLSLSEEEIIRIYGKRWSIEVFFKVCKSTLRLTRECRSLSYDAMTAWTAIVFTRYVMLTLLNRMYSDDRTVGELFYRVCEELADITWQESYCLLIEAFVKYVSEKLLLTEEQMKIMFKDFMRIFQNC